jgi:hypothetical protein
VNNKLLIGGGLVVVLGGILLLTHNKAAVPSTSGGTTSTTSGGSDILVPSAPTLSPQDQEAYYANMPAAGISQNVANGVGNGVTQIGPGLAILNSDPSVNYEPLGLPAAQPTILGI